jgi:hypothetical protein
MSDKITQIAMDANSNGHLLADLERRVQVLESRIALLPDSQQIEERVTERIKAGMPPPPPPVDPSQAPGFRDIEIPIPSVQNVVAAAKTGWALFEMLREVKALFWTLFDRRYHMAWLTRFFTLAILVMVMTSDYWFPLATYDNVFSRLWDKLVNVLLCLIMFTVLSLETRRYKEWRGGQRS